MKKSALVLSFIMTLTMTACGGGNDEGLVDITEKAEITTVGTTAATSVTVSETTAATTAETEAAAEELNVIPESAYDNAPWIIIDSEDKPFGTIEDVFSEESFLTDDGYEYCYYSMTYPKLTVENKTAEKKINDFFVSFEKEKHLEFKESTEDYNINNIIKADRPMDTEKWSYEVINNSGNIFSVNMICFSDSCTAMHGIFFSNVFNFDIRTGELIDGSEIITDIRKISGAFSKSFYDYRYIHNGGIYAYASVDFISEDKIAEEYFVEWFPKKFCVKNGSICMFLDPYEGGSFADGIRYMPIPLSEAEPYLTDYAKDLFSNTTSSTAVKMTPYLENGEVKYSAENKNFKEN